MARREFLTVPDELVEYANTAVDWFEARGYSLKIEHNEVAYPYRPTLRCKRSRTTLLVEVAVSIEVERLAEWARYGKSASGDTRVAAVLPADASRKATDEAKLRTLGVGLYIVESDNATELIAPKDLALNLEPPELRKLPPKVRKAVGSAYDQFDRSQWREGFEDICQALETAARTYLLQGLRSGRIILRRSSGKAWTPTDAQVGKMTLGALADVYGTIQTPNHVDSIVGVALEKLNKDRVGVAHHKGKPAAEIRLRKNVGRNIWLAINTLRELLR